MTTRQSKVVSVHAMKAYRGILFLTSMLVESEWPTSCPTPFIRGREPQYPFRRFGGPQTQSG